MRQIIIGGVVTFVALAIIACSSSPTDTTAGADTANKGTSSSSSGSTSSTSSSSGKPGPSTSSSTSSSGGGTSSSTSSTSSTSSSSSGGADGGTCAPSQGADACVSCCEAKFPAGTTKMDALDQAFDTCACTAAVCQTQCAASECAATPVDPKTGDACDTCLSGTTADPCNNTWETGCQADADCKQLEACEDSCAP